jgi:hypothetical protein
MTLLCPVCAQEGTRSLIRASEMGGQIRLHVCSYKHRFAATYLLLPREGAPAWAKPEEVLWRVRYYPADAPSGLVVPEGFLPEDQGLYVLL